MFMVLLINLNAKWINVYAIGSMIKSHIGFIPQQFINRI
jgi:hypothetical protein